MSWGSTYTEIDGEPVDLRAPIAYEMTDKILRTGRNGRRKLQNHTYMERIDEHTVGVKLHDTYVVKLHDDGSTSLDSGGWHTMTTKDRINAYLPSHVQVGSDRGRWYVYVAPLDSVVRHEKQQWNAEAGAMRGTGVFSEYTPWDARERSHRFFDGIRIAADGTIVNPRRAEMEAQEAREKDIQKRMTSYIRKYIAALKVGIPMPGPGDCWGCTTEAMGDSHLLDHFDEDYFVPSLLVNAYRERGYGDYRLVMAMDLDYEMLKAGEGLRLTRSGADIGRNLRRYLKPRVMPEVQR